MAIRVRPGMVQEPPLLTIVCVVRAFGMCMVVPFINYFIIGLRIYLFSAATNEMLGFERHQEGGRSRRPAPVLRAVQEAAAAERVPGLLRGHRQPHRLAGAKKGTKEKDGMRVMSRL